MPVTPRLLELVKTINMFGAPFSPSDNRSPHSSTAQTPRVEFPVGEAPPTAPRRALASPAAAEIRRNLTARDFPAAFETTVRLLVQDMPEASEQAIYALLDRLLLLCFLERQGWLGSPQSSLAGQLQDCCELDEQDDSFFRTVLAPHWRTLENVGLAGDSAALQRLPALLPNRLFQLIFAQLIAPFSFSVPESFEETTSPTLDPGVVNRVLERFSLERAKPSTTQRKAPVPYQTAQRSVRWMCREVLIQYLTAELTGFTQLAETEVRARLVQFLALPPAEQMNEEQTAQLPQLFLRVEAQRMSLALLACRVCDPMIGGGAFLAGMLEELTRVLARLDLMLYGRAIIQQHNYLFRLKRRLIADCLYGVDRQEAAVRYTRQRLWLALVAAEQSAPDASLAVTMREAASVNGLFTHIVCGDSLLGCRVFDEGPQAEQTPPAFKWRRNFAAVFAERGGFDLLIGNPPARAEIGRDVLPQLCALFPHLRRAQNPVAAFLDLPRLIGAPNVIACQVVPKSLTSAEGWNATRASVRRNYALLLVADTGKDFSSAQQGQEVLLYTRNQTATETPPEMAVKGVGTLTELQALSGGEPVREPATVAPEAATASTAFEQLTPSERELAERLAHYRTLGEYAVIKHGQRWQRRSAARTSGKHKGELVPLIKVTSIRAFRLTGEQLLVEPPAYIQRVLEEIRQPKLVCTQTLARLQRPQETLVLSCAVDRSGAVGANSVIQIFPHFDCPFSLEFLCALFNSSFARWFYSAVVYRHAARAEQLDLPQTALLPLPRPKQRLIPRAEKLAHKLAALAEPPKYYLRGQNRDYDALDDLLCDLFELSAEEVRLILRQE